MNSRNFPCNRVLGSSAKRRSEKFALGGELVPYHRFDWPSRGYRVCVPMHYLPGAIFWPKDHRNPQIEWGNILLSAKLGPVALYPHNVGQLRGHILLYDIEASDLATADLQCGTLHSLSDLIPSMRWRAKGVSEGYVVPVGEHLLIRFGVAFDELA